MSTVQNATHGTVCDPKPIGNLADADVGRSIQGAGCNDPLNGHFRFRVVFAVSGFVPTQLPGSTSVGGVCIGVEMGRVHARRVVAGMADFFAIGNGAVVNDEAVPMRPHEAIASALSLRPIPENPISILVDATCIEPTSIVISPVYSRPESFWNSEAVKTRTWIVGIAQSLPPLIVQAAILVGIKRFLAALDRTLFHQFSILEVDENAER